MDQNHLMGLTAGHPLIYQSFVVVVMMVHRQGHQALALLSPQVHQIFQIVLVLVS